MSDIGDWLWLAVAVLWIVFRVLPRLFRGRRRETPPARPHRPAAIERPEMPEADEQGRPPPIEPR